jgi:hypothetical protein
LPKDHKVLHENTNEAVARSALPVRVSQKFKQEKEMNTLLTKFISKRSLGMMALLGLAALAGSGPLAFGQETVQGRLTLPVEARLGNTVLPPGEYKLNVALVGTTLSVNSIQDVYTPVMVMVSPLTKGGPVASVLAMAYKPDLRNPKAMDIQPDGSGKMIHSIPLDNFGLVLQIIDGKSGNTLRARGPEMAQGVASAKASD